MIPEALSLSVFAPDLVNKYRCEEHESEPGLFHQVGARSKRCVDLPGRLHSFEDGFMNAATGDENEIIRCPERHLLNERRRSIVSKLEESSLDGPLRNPPDRSSSSRTASSPAPKSAAYWVHRPYAKRPSSLCISSRASSPAANNSGSSTTRRTPPPYSPCPRVSHYCVDLPSTCWNRSFTLPSSSVGRPLRGIAR
jgi:hypothetical protein